MAQEVGARLDKREILFGPLPLRTTPNHVGTRNFPVMTVLRVVLGDQLSLGLTALDGIDQGRDVILMMEVMEESTHVRHHKQRIVLVVSAMRPFAQKLRQHSVCSRLCQAGLA